MHHKTHLKETCTIRTPIWAANDGVVSHTVCSITCYTEVGKFNGSILVREDVGALDISMDDTLVVEIDQSLEYLRYIDCDKVFWEFTESFEDSVQ